MKPIFESRLIRTRSGSKLNCLVKDKASKNTSAPQQQNSDLFQSVKEQTDLISREQWISDAAYFLSEARGFAPGRELDDWLAAEQNYVEMLVDLFLYVCWEDGIMTVQGLQQLAKAIGVQRPECVDSKLKLIRLIQSASRHRPCFRTKPGEFCNHQSGCQWGKECQKLVAEYWR